MKANHVSFAGKRLNVLKYIMFLAICVIAIAAVTIPALASAAVNNQNAKPKVEVAEDKTFDEALKENPDAVYENKDVPSNATSIKFTFYDEGWKEYIEYGNYFDKWAADPDTLLTVAADNKALTWTSDKFTDNYSTLSIENGSYINDRWSAGIKLNLKSSSVNDKDYFIDFHLGWAPEEKNCDYIKFTVNGEVVDGYDLKNITVIPNTDNTIVLSHVYYDYWHQDIKKISCYFPAMCESLMEETKYVKSDEFEFYFTDDFENKEDYYPKDNVSSANITGFKSSGFVQISGAMCGPRQRYNTSSWLNICVHSSSDVYITADTDSNNSSQDGVYTLWTTQYFNFYTIENGEKTNIGSVEITLYRGNVYESDQDRDYICEQCYSSLMPNMYEDIDIYKDNALKFVNPLEFGGKLKFSQVIVFDIACDSCEVSMNIDTKTVKSEAAASSAKVQLTRNSSWMFGDVGSDDKKSQHIIDSNASFSTVLPKNYITNDDGYEWKLTWNNDDTLTIESNHICLPERDTPYNFYTYLKGKYTFEAKSPTANDDVVFSGWRIFDNLNGDFKLDQSSIGYRNHYVNTDNDGNYKEFKRGSSIYIDRNIDIYAIFSDVVTISGQVKIEDESQPGTFKGLNGIEVEWTDKEKGEKQEKFAYVGVDNLDASDNDVVNIQTEDTSKYKDSVGDGYYELHIPWDVEGEVFIDPAQDGIKDYLAAGYMLDMVKTQITESTSKVDLYLMLGKRVNINTQGKGTFSQFYYVNGGSTPIPGPQDTDEFFFGMDENGVLYLERQTEPDNKLVLHYYNEFENPPETTNTVDVIWVPNDNNDNLLKYLTINGEYMQEGVNYKVSSDLGESVEIVPHYVGFANVTFIPINCFLSCSYQVGETDPVYYSIYDNSSDRLYEDGKVSYYGAPMFSINWDTPVPESKYVISESGTAFVIPYYNCEFQGITVNGMPLLPGFTLEAGKHYDIFIYCKSQTPEPPVPPTPPVPPEPPTPPTPPTPPIPPEPVPPTPVPPVPVPPTPVDPGTGAQTGDVNGVNVIVLIGLLVVASSVVCFRNRKKFN